MSSVRRTPGSGTDAPSLVPSSRTRLKLDQKWGVSGIQLLCRQTTTEKGGANIKAQLGYRMNGSSSYAGLETISDGDRASNIWKMSWPCKKAVGLLKVKGQGTFETPAATFPGC